MKGLFVKDIRMMMGQKKFFCLVFLMAVILNFSSNSAYVVYYLTFVCSFFAMNSISYDEADNGYPFLFTLPIDRSIYVREKYLFGIVLNVSSWLAGMCVGLVFEVVNNNIPSFTENIPAMALMLPVMLIFNSVVFPVLFKFGSEKGRIVMLCVFGIAFFIGYMLSRLANLRKLVHIANGYPASVLALSLVAVTVLILTVSCAVSVMIMKKKEL